MGLIETGLNFLTNLVGGGGGEKVKQEPMLLPEQRGAISKLYNIASGKAGSPLGKAYTGDMGDYSMTGLEQTAQQQLQERLQTEPTFEQYEPLIQEIREQGEETADVLRREQARTGTLYSRGMLESQGELQEDVQSQIGQLLANRYDQALGRQAQDIGRAYQFGGLPRELNQAEAQMEYKDWLRQHDERLKELDILQNVASTRVPYGVKEVETQSPMTSFFNEASGQMGSELISRMFSGKGASGGAGTWGGFGGSRGYRTGMGV